MRNLVLGERIEDPLRRLGSACQPCRAMHAQSFVSRDIGLSVMIVDVDMVTQQERIFVARI
jgi:hypothetical protein